MCLAPHDYTVSRNSEWLDTFRVVVVDFRALEQSRESLWRRSSISVENLLLLHHMRANMNSSININHKISLELYIEVPGGGNLSNRTMICYILYSYQIMIFCFF